MYYSKVMLDEVEFEDGNDVYVKRREEMSSCEEEEPEVEECWISFKAGKSVTIVWVVFT